MCAVLNVSVRAVPGGTQEGNTPLTFAVQRGHFEVVKLLLEHGTEPNAKNSVRARPLLLCVACAS